MDQIKKSIKLSSRFQLTLPNDIRTAADISPNEILTIELNPENKILLSKFRTTYDEIKSNAGIHLKPTSIQNKEKVVSILENSFGILSHTMH